VPPHFGVVQLTGRASQPFKHNSSRKEAAMVQLSCANGSDSSQIAHVASSIQDLPELDGLKAGSSEWLDAITQNESLMTTLIALRETLDQQAGKNNSFNTALNDDATMFDIEYTHAEPQKVLRTFEQRLHAASRSKPASDRTLRLSDDEETNTPGQIVRRSRTKSSSDTALDRAAKLLDDNESVLPGQMADARLEEWLATAEKRSDIEEDVARNILQTMQRSYGAIDLAMRCAYKSSDAVRVAQSCGVVHDLLSNDLAPLAICGRLARLREAAADNAGTKNLGSPSGLLDESREQDLDPGRLMDPEAIASLPLLLNAEESFCQLRGTSATRSTSMSELEQM
jgi:hypothetical protein